MEQGYKVNACNLLLVNSVPEMLFNDVMPKIKTPIFLALAGQERVISNEKAKEFYNRVSVEDKTLLEYEDACHSIIQDKEYASLLMRDVISWQNRHLHQ